MPDGAADLALNVIKYAFNEVDMNHEWKVEFKKVRDIIVLGRDKHDYFNEVAQYEEDELNNTNTWLEDHNFSTLH